MWQMQATGARVGEELKHFIEHGRAHPRQAGHADVTAHRDF